MGGGEAGGTWGCWGEDEEYGWWCAGPAEMDDVKAEKGWGGMAGCLAGTW